MTLKPLHLFFPGILLIAQTMTAGTIIIQPLPTINSTEGNGFINTVVAQFTDSDSATSIGALTATINWGDGTLSTGSLTQSGGVGTTFSLLGSHTYSEEGTYTDSVSISDNGQTPVTANGSASILDAPLTGLGFSSLPAVQNMMFSGVLASFSDGDPFAFPSDYSVTINWGDGTAPFAATILQPGGVGTPFQVSGSHLYSASGTFGVTIGIDDVGGSTATVTGNENVSATPEPGAFLLCGAGILLLVARSRMSPARR